MAFCVGLDLGQSADFTALAVLEHGKREVPGRENGEVEQFLHLRHLERYQLHTPYPEIAEKVATLMQEPRLSPREYDASRRRHFQPQPSLVVDNTGVGRAVTDLLKTKGLKFIAVTITGGNEVHASSSRAYRVPKRDLVGALEVPFHTGTLKVAEGMELWPTLRKELLNFRRKINLTTAHDSYEHWRESDHDDLVLAAALACWNVTRRRGRTKLKVIR